MAGMGWRSRDPSFESTMGPDTEGIPFCPCGRSRADAGNLMHNAKTRSGHSRAICAPLVTYLYTCSPRP
jgi:hypothetical protein